MQTMEELVKGHRDAVSVGRVFGEPIEQNGVTVIPAAKVMGGGGGGAGESQELSEKGVGTGYGMAAWPTGAYVIRGADVTWQPALDVNRLVTGAFVVAGLALVLGFRARKT
jgi:uncharacterized spore protein YtfJ